MGNKVFSSISIKNDDSNAVYMVELLRNRRYRPIYSYEILPFSGPKQIDVCDCCDNDGVELVVQIKKIYPSFSEQYGNYRFKYFKNANATLCYNINSKGFHLDDSNCCHIGKMKLINEWGEREISVYKAMVEANDKALSTPTLRNQYIGQKKEFARLFPQKYRFTKMEVHFRRPQDCNSTCQSSRIFVQGESKEYKFDGSDAFYKDGNQVTLDKDTDVNLVAYSFLTEDHLEADEIFQVDPKSNRCAEYTIRTVNRVPELFLKIIE